METISNIFELLVLLSMAAWLAAPSARSAWARATARRDEMRSSIAPPTDVEEGE